jgi:hypothetical protein
VPDEAKLQGNPDASPSIAPVQSWPRPRRTTPSTMIAAVLAAVLIALATILVLNHGSVLFGQPGSASNPVLIYIDGIDRNVTYKGNLPHYFGPSINDSCPYCPVGAQVGGAIRIPLATWSPPQNLSFWVFTNVSGPFPVQAPGCSPAPCTFPWLKVWSFETFVHAGVLTSMTLFSTFLLPNQPTGSLNIIDLNATFCPASICAPPPT